MLIPKNPKSKMRNPGTPAMPKRKQSIKAPIKAPGAPAKGPSLDDTLLRSMPITEKQLGAIKRTYGIK